LRKQLGAAEGYRHWPPAPAPPAHARQRHPVSVYAPQRRRPATWARAAARPLVLADCLSLVAQFALGAGLAPGADPNGPAAALSPARAARPRRGSRVPPAARANRSRPPAWAACAGRTDDGAKQLVGRRRHVLVDTEGLVIALAVHLADSIGRNGPRWHQASARRLDPGSAAAHAAARARCGL